MQDAAPFRQFHAFSALPKRRVLTGFTEGHKALPGVKFRQERCT